MTDTPHTRVRRVRPADVETVVALVHELAAYEQASEECRLSNEQLHTALFGDQPALFGDQPALFGHVAEHDGEVVGMTLWFLNFSTWDGVHGIYLEDLFVLPRRRGLGLGKSLLIALAEECVRHGYSRLQWWVLDWNTPSIEFYRSLGAVAMDEWTIMRVSGDALLDLGGHRGATAEPATG